MHFLLPATLALAVLARALPTPDGGLLNLGLILCQLGCRGQFDDCERSAHDPVTKTECQANLAACNAECTYDNQ